MEIRNFPGRGFTLGPTKTVGNSTGVTTTPKTPVDSGLNIAESVDLSIHVPLKDGQPLVTEPKNEVIDETPKTPANPITITPAPNFNGPLTIGLQDSLPGLNTLPGASIRFTPTSEPSANGPLVSFADLEPTYMGEIRVLESRYPGVADKLKAFEIEAAEKGYCPIGSKPVEAALLESPPWPTTEYGNARANIGAKAKELQAANSDLNTGDATKYDFDKATVASEKLMETLDGLFPSKEMPDLAISTRAKAPKSLSNKMAKMLKLDPEYTLAHLTDTVGARIDAPDLKSMGEVATRLEKLYEGKIVAKSDYVTNPGDNGYRAIHYIIDIGGRMAEIQTSTQSLRTADLATHDTVYKAEFPVSPESSKELSTAADRIMFLECLKATKGSDGGT